MKKNISLWQTAGFAVTSLAGTLLHFLYGLTGESIFAAPFCAVNESTWEHMKILFIPMLLFAAVESFFFRDEGSFWCVKLSGIMLGLAAVPVIFYTYNGAVAKSPDWVNILIFFIAAALAYFTEYRMLKKGTAACSSPIAARAALAAAAALFILFTFITPEIGIFRDPLTGSYGVFG